MPLLMVRLNHSKQSDAVNIKKIVSFLGALSLQYKDMPKSCIQQPSRTYTTTCVISSPSLVKINAHLCAL